MDVTIRAEGPWAEISVVDNGPGIAPEFLPHIFERFRQADSSSTGPMGDWDWDWRCMRHLVELHGGQVEAHNRMDGPGARFGLRLRTMSPPGSGGPEDPETAHSSNRSGWMGSMCSSSTTTSTRASCWP